ncbi:NmrA/HSCARG family protein [Chroococcidiopsis cubana]|nr:NmrA/HSCARG family protein [Chroococcidiopsis cubana]
MNQSKSILVVGATGALGRAVIEHLLIDRQNSWHIRGFTRNPNSERARQLATLSDRIELIEGDNNDIASITRAVQGVEAIFCHTDFWATYNHELTFNPWYPGQSPWEGYQRAEETERNQGLNFLKVAKAEGVKHFVYSSLEACRELSAERIPCPHFDSKASVERYIDQMRSSGDEWYAQSTTVLVALPYFENFFLVEDYGSKPEPGADNQYWATPGLGLVNTCLSQSHNGSNRLVFCFPIADTPWPMIALDDIGVFAAHVFAHREQWGGRTLKIGSEALRTSEMAEIFTKVTGIPSVLESSSIDEYRALPMPEAEDIAAMFEFAQSFGMPRDYEFLRKLHPGLLTFENWLRKTNWHGESRV